MYQTSKKRKPRSRKILPVVALFAIVVSIVGIPNSTLFVSGASAATVSSGLDRNLVEVDASVDEIATSDEGAPEDADILEDASPATTPPTLAAVTLTTTGTFVDESGDGFAQVGETIDYAFVVENTGEQALTNVNVVDTVGGVTMSGLPISLAPEATDSSTFNASYALTDADVTAGQFTTQATVQTDQGATDISGATAADDEVTVVNVVGEPTVALPEAVAIQEENADSFSPVAETGSGASVALVKSGFFNDENGDKAPQVGETIQFNFVIENTGDVPLTNLTVSDTVGGVTLSGSPLPLLNPGGLYSLAYTATYTLIQADVDAGTFTNSATVVTDEGATDISGTTNITDDVTVVQLDLIVDLRVNVVSAPSLYPGETGAFVVEAHNDGPGASDFFHVIYELQDFVSLDLSQPLPDICRIDGNRIDCTVLGPLPAGDSVSLTFPVQLSADVTSVGLLPETDVQIIKQHLEDPDASNDVSQMGVTVLGRPVSGHVFHDFDRDGVIDDGEVDVSGVDVALVGPGADGTLGTDDDVTLDTQTTASPYTFANLAGGTYWVVIDESTLPLGMLATNDIDGANDNTIEVVVDGATVGAQDFGVHYAAVTGVLIDDNGTPITNTEITVTDSDGNTFVGTTNGEGLYFIEGNESNPMTPGEVTITAISNGETVTRTATVVNAAPAVADLQATFVLPVATVADSPASSNPSSLAYTGQSLMAQFLMALQLVAAGIFLTAHSRKSVFTGVRA